MGFLNFLFARLFIEYQRKNQSPEFNITLYISVVYLFILFSLSLPISVIINKKLFDGELHYNKAFINTGVFLAFGLVTFLTYVKYIKEKLIYRLATKYQSKKISRLVLYFLIVIIPLTFFLLGGTITVLVTGGTMLNTEFKGLLN
jgi:hypothetical protein